MAQADADVKQYLALVPALKRLSQRTFWAHYDPEADILAVHFTEPNLADDSQMTDDDVIIRNNAARDGIGLIILHASKR